jgi:hypothetical protein
MMPKERRDLAITFGSESLTHYSGVDLRHRFLSRIGCKNAVATDISLIQRNSRYTGGKCCSLSCTL